MLNRSNCWVLSLLLAGLVPGQEARPEGFVVHEWGTFTSFQGVDGTGLEGLHRAEEGLPGFVHRRSDVGHPVPPDRLLKGIAMPLRGVTQKMETPVLYFHGALPPRVQVRVEFVRGLISEWYPAAAEFGPALGKPRTGAFDLGRVERSFLRWDVDLLPAGSEAPAELPAVEPDDPWGFARRVDSAWVRTRAPAGGKAGLEAERYLFYRGLGTFELPVHVEAHGNGTGALRNDGDALPFVVVVEATQERMRFQALGCVAHGATPFDLARGFCREPEPTRAKLHALLVDELARAGLFRDEATAMVDTWARSWLAQPGTRVLYIVPRPAVDALLPLVIEPPPARIERVLLGRIEFLTPESEREVLAALAACAAAEGKLDEPALAGLARFDRFLEPVLRRALAIAPGEHPARQVATRMLSMLE